MCFHMGLNSDNNKAMRKVLGLLPMREREHLEMDSRERESAAAWIKKQHCLRVYMAPHWEDHVASDHCVAADMGSPICSGNEDHVALYWLTCHHT
jgi:hypothetical protein